MPFNAPWGERAEELCPPNVLWGAALIAIGYFGPIFTALISPDVYQEVIGDAAVIRVGGTAVGTISDVIVLSGLFLLIAPKVSALLTMWTGRKR